MAHCGKSVTSQHTCSIRRWKLSIVRDSCYVEAVEIRSPSRRNPPASARVQAQIEGDLDLGEKVLSLTAMVGAVRIVDRSGSWPADGEPAARATPTCPHFTDIAPKSKFSYRTNNNYTGRKYFPQPICGGVGIHCEVEPTLQPVSGAVF